MNTDKIKEVFEEICEDLEMTENPPILLVGDEAYNFVENHFEKNSKDTSSLSKINGMFLYESLDREYIEKNKIDSKCFEVGIVCLIKKRISTLAHEMKHAEQLKRGDEYIFLDGDYKKKERYSETYVYYPSEEEAFSYALEYLKKESKKKVSFESVWKCISSVLTKVDACRKHFFYKMNYLSLRLEYYQRNKKWIKNNQSTIEVKI